MTEHEHEDKREHQAYELGYHLVPSLGEQDLALRVEEIHTVLADMGATLVSEGQPQSCVLAYTMRKQRAGKWSNYDTSHFGWVRFRSPAEGIASLKEMLDQNEFMIRYLLIKIGADALVQPSAASERRTSTEGGGEVAVEPKTLVRKVDAEEKGEVSEEELDKQIEQLIH